MNSNIQNEAKGVRIFPSGATRNCDNEKLVDLAWAAGFYDGEGSVSCGHNNGNPHTRIQLSIGQRDNDEDIAETLKKFKSILGCGNIYRKTHIGKEINQHQYLIAKSSNVKFVLNLLWPYLSTTKKKQAKKALLLLEKGQKDLQVSIAERQYLTKARRSKSHKGQVPWNKGKKGKINENI